MRIGLTYNLRKEDSEQSAELLLQEDVDRLADTINQIGYNVVPIEVTAPPATILEQLNEARPDLIFNVAEGVDGTAREAYYPAIFELLGIPFTGSHSFVLHVGLDKRLTEAVLAQKDIRVPWGFMVRDHTMSLPEDAPFPLIIKPNAEGSSKGISRESIVHDRETACHRIADMLSQFPAGVVVEQFIEGRELVVPWLEVHSGGLLEIVEWQFDTSDEPPILDYERKERGDIKPVCPPDLTPRQRQAVLAMADRSIRALALKDFGRVDLRLSQDGTPYLIEVNALPGLRPSFSFMQAAAQKGYTFADVIGGIIETAARRHGITPGSQTVSASVEKRTSAHAHGIRVGRFPVGPHNAITDVPGVCVGHVTRIEDKEPGTQEKAPATIRTGVTAIVPSPHRLFDNHLVCGGFILNGIGEMSGLTQAIEWGWLETPIVLTNTMSIGEAHRGIIQFMLESHPELGHDLSVVIPLVGETDDSFLSDVRMGINSRADALRAIHEASAGPVEQGSVGGGTGMISFDFAGGIGSASRRLPAELGHYTIGVLVQSNFGKLRNLTLAGRVVGKELDAMYPYQDRREDDRGSVIVVLATDAPLLSSQLNQVAKRAALGLGRVGSHASAASGEIALAFSVANPTPRTIKKSTRHLNLSFVSEEFINPLYEAAVECTEEAVLNAMLHSEGMTGRLGRVAPAIPTERILKMLGSPGSVSEGSRRHA